MNHCPKCSENVRPSAKFCFSCGFAFESSQSKPPIQSRVSSRKDSVGGRRVRSTSVTGDGRISGQWGRPSGQRRLKVGLGVNDGETVGRSRVEVANTSEKGLIYSSVLIVLTVFSIIVVGFVLR